MKSGSLLRNSIIAVSTLLAMPLAVLAQREPQKKAVHFPHYAVTDLGTLGAGNSAAALDMNNVGWVAAGRPDRPPAAATRLRLVWSAPEDLGTLENWHAHVQQCGQWTRPLGQTAVGSESGAGS